MTNLDPTAQVPLSCPKCGQQFKKAVRELQGGAHFPCPNGNCEVVFNPADFAAALKEVDESIDQLARDLGKMFK